MPARVRWSLVMLVSAAVAVESPATASAVSVTLGRPNLTVGTTLAGLDAVYPLSYASGYNSALSSGLVAAPADGTITSWRVRGATQNGGHVTLHVMRAEADGRFKSTADSVAASILDGAYSNPTFLPIEAGNTIGVVVGNYPDHLPTEKAQVYSMAATGGAWRVSGNLLSTGSGPATFGAPAANEELLYNATVDLEPPGIIAMTPASGPPAGGTAVTIAGRHLAVTTAVTFGGVPAQSFSGDNGTVTAIAPPHAPGPVNVRLTTAGGDTFASAASQFTYTGDSTDPVLGGLRVRPKTFRTRKTGSSRRAAPIGTRISYQLSEPATVIFRASRVAPGRRAGKRCVKPNRTNRTRKPCRRGVRVKGSFTDDGVAGRNRVAFAGRIRRRALRPGSYRLRAVATDAAGNASTPATVSFRVVK